MCHSNLSNYGPKHSLLGSPKVKIDSEIYELVVWASLDIVRLVINQLVFLLLDVVVS